jgi:magnesium-transporting ATPase (P-type)
MENAFAKTIDEVLSAFDVDPKKGLTDEQVEQLRVKYGKNGKPSPCRRGLIGFSSY